MKRILFIFALLSIVFFACSNSIDDEEQVESTTEEEIENDNSSSSRSLSPIIIHTERLPVPKPNRCDESDKPIKREGRHSKD